MNSTNRLFVVFLWVISSAVFSQEKLDVFNVARNGTTEHLLSIVKSNPKEINNINSDGYSPLILACYRGNNEVAKMLIENGADINYKSALGSPLMACVVKNNNEIAKILISKGANVNITDANGMTAILYATMFKNYEITRLLVKNKADILAKDIRGNSALDYAILADDDTLIEILKTK
jgi:hypothetical protein